VWAYHEHMSIQLGGIEKKVSMNIPRRIMEKISIMVKGKNRRTYISQTSKTSCVELFQKGVKPKAVLEQLISKIPTLTIEQVYRQYNAFNRKKNQPEPTLDGTLKDLVGTSENRIPVDTKGNQFLAQAMSKQQNSSTDLEAIKADLLEKAEVFAELSSICSKAAIALGDASAIVGWESPGRGNSETLWTQITDFLGFIKDEKLANIS